MHTDNKTQKIAFIGAGNMAKAIIAGLIAAKYSAQSIIAVNRSLEKNQQLEDEFGIKTSQNAAEAAHSADIIVLGVKPQNMTELLFDLQHTVAWKNKLVISLAAGIKIGRLHEMANYPLRLVRAMPNTPALVGKGMTGLFAEPSLTLAEKQIAEKLLNTVGKTTWVNAEDEINNIIAAAGSAPAYFFLFMEAMQQEAERQGLTAKQARLLIEQTALGAATLAQSKSDISFAKLREQVTSKGGTTAEALKIFDEANLSSTIANAMQAAMRRAKEMESLF